MASGLVEISTDQVNLFVHVLAIRSFFLDDFDNFWLYTGSLCLLFLPLVIVVGLELFHSGYNNCRVWWVRVGVDYIINGVVNLHLLRLVLHRRAVRARAQRCRHTVTLNLLNFILFQTTLTPSSRYWGRILQLIDTGLSRRERLDKTTLSRALVFVHYHLGDQLRLLLGSSITHGRANSEISGMVLVRGRGWWVLAWFSLLGYQWWHNWSDRRIRHSARSGGRLLIVILIWWRLQLDITVLLQGQTFVVAVQMLLLVLLVHHYCRAHQFVTHHVLRRDCPIGCRRIVVLYGSIF